MCLYYRAKRGLEVPSLGSEITPFPEVGIVRDERMFQVKTFFRAEVVLAQRAVRAFSSSGKGISPPFCCSATYLFVQVADSFRFSENCACRHAPSERRERSSRDRNDSFRKCNLRKRAKPRAISNASIKGLRKQAMFSCEARYLRPG